MFTQKQTLRGKFESKLLMWDMIPGSPSREVKRGGKEGYCWWWLVPSPVGELREMAKNTERARRL